MIDVWKDRKVFSEGAIDDIINDMGNETSDVPAVSPRNSIPRAQEPSTLHEKRNSTQISSPREVLPAFDEQTKIPVVTYDALENVGLGENEQELLDKMDQFDTDSVLGDLLSERLGNSVANLENFIKAVLRGDSKTIGDVNYEQQQVLEDARDEIAKLSHFRSRMKGDDIVSLEEAKADEIVNMNEKVDGQEQEEETNDKADENDENEKKRKREKNSDPYELVETVEHIRLSRTEMMTLITERKKRAVKSADICADILGRMEEIETTSKAGLKSLDDKSENVKSKVEKYKNMSTQLKSMLRKVLAITRTESPTLNTTKNTNGTTNVASNQEQSTTSTSNDEVNAYSQQSNTSKYLQPAIGWAASSTASATSSSSYGSSTWGNPSSNSWYSGNSGSGSSSSAIPTSTWNASSSTTSPYAYNQSYSHGWGSGNTNPYSTMPSYPPSQSTASTSSWSSYPSTTTTNNATSTSSTWSTYNPTTSYQQGQSQTYPYSMQYQQPQYQQHLQQHQQQQGPGTSNASSSYQNWKTTSNNNR